MSDADEIVGSRVMVVESFGTKYRSIANQRLTKTLLIGLGGSALLHTVAITGVSYLAQNNTTEQMEIVEIERVEVDPKPSAAPLIKPIIPIAKPSPAPEPKVVKPPIIAAVPSPIPVKIPTPKAILTPPTVIKITKSARVEPSASPLSNIISSAIKPASSPAKTAVTIPRKLNLLPSFSNKLFSNPPSKNAPSEPAIENQIQPLKVLPESPKMATKKIDNIPLQNIPINAPQPTTANNPAALASASKLTKLAPTFNSDPTDHPPAAAAELSYDLPGHTSKLAQTPDRSISGNNQTSIANQPKSPQGFGNDFGRIPGNNTQIAQSNSGVNQGNLANSDGDNQRSSPLSATTRTGTDGKPGNMATGSRNRVSIQCLRNCEIRYPDELENSDIGKDKILVKVTIDPNGLVTNAEISRSSGNQNLDRVTLAGVKQMQLNATGETRTYRIKISTLLR
jgi:TonB family protein